MIAAALGALLVCGKVLVGDAPVTFNSEVSEPAARIVEPISKGEPDFRVDLDFIKFWNGIKVGRREHFDSIRGDLDGFRTHVLGEFVSCGINSVVNPTASGKKLRGRPPIVLDAYRYFSFISKRKNSYDGQICSRGGFGGVLCQSDLIAGGLSRQLCGIRAAMRPVLSARIKNPIWTVETTTSAAVKKANHSV
jgi:hypothetical protein